MSKPYDHDHEKDVIYFARTNFRNAMRKFGIKTDDRRRHLYCIGKTGVGKTTALENIMLSDIYLGHGVGIVDPHGDSAEKILDYIPPHRINDIVYFNPADVDHPVGFNVLEVVREDQKHLVASGLMLVFKKIWPDVWSARMEHIMNNCILALLENPGNTLLGINRLLVDRDFRRKIISNIKDPVVKSFWITEYEQWQDKFRSEAIAPIQNKVSQFLSTSLIRNIVGQVHSTVQPRDIMDNRQILVMNLSKGRIGEDASALLGGLMITRLQLAAMERVDIPEEDRQDFYLFIDEFQNFATDAFANILSEARKYHLNLIMAHQYIEQLEETVAAAVFGNVGTIMAFRVGGADAVKLAVEFAPRFIEEDLVNLPKFNVYMKLMIDGVASEPFSAITLPPVALRTGNAEKVINASREKYSVSRQKIEAEIMSWSETKPVVTREVPGMPAEAPAKKKASRPLFDYDCSRCNKHMQIPVELDRNRPIYCEDCIEIVREERASGKKPERKSRNQEIKKPVAPPKAGDGKVVKKDLPGLEMSLDALKSGNKKEDKKPVEEKKPTAETSLPKEGQPPPKKNKRKRRKSRPSDNQAASQPKADENGVFPW
ncbi:type IV secretion system DNA-binding domain-containing protein [Patescibacteria group bacterium]|nr:type IV secretion system DNA-binding domain-containing protein [Patescibacteria group bacterium]MBU1907125.1 type IV secretion system DNA-binding domain-containing protein [Patescibacteria group bacterium]